MGYAADLHLHSAYAYASSKDLSLENLAIWARLKGIDLLSCGDFTHPAWFEELKHKLEEVGPGLYQLGGVNFVLGTEVSCVYRQGGRGRRVHVLLIVPGFEAASQVKSVLSQYGNVANDGRPTLSLSARDLAGLVLDIDPECLIIPAHVWTPWYGVYGSKSGFDHLEECFLDLTPQIHAVETGLSSDPMMNWGVLELIGRTIVSFSDAHSLPKLGRELTFFKGDLSYRNLAEALTSNQVEFTVEFYPEEGKYHYDGHRRCGVCRAPDVAQRQNNRCPVCDRPLTLGVLNRTQQLSRGAAAGGRQLDGFVHSPQGRPPFIRLVPLLELVSEALTQGPSTKLVRSEYQRIVRELGSELLVLLRATASDLESVAGERLAQAILRARRGDIQVEPGYDGVYGRVSIWPDCRGPS